MASTDEWFGGYTVESGTDGVTVEKGIDLETLPLPAIKLRVRSDRDERVGVLVREQVHEDLGVESVGFHPEHGADDWTVYEDGTLAWAVSLEPGESLTTVYGVWLTEPNQLFGFLEDSTLERVEPLERYESWWPAEESTARKHLLDESLAASGPEPLGEMRDRVEETLSGTIPDVAADDDEPVAVPPAEDDPAAHDDPAVPTDEMATAADDGDDESVVWGSGDEPTGVPDAVWEPTVARGGAADLAPPTRREVTALADGVTPERGRRLFLRTIIDRDHGGAPAVLQELVTAMTVVGRRVERVEAGVRFDAVVDSDHEIRGLADALAARDCVRDVLVTTVAGATDESTAGDASASSTSEFDLLKREVEPVSPTAIEAELAASTPPGAEAEVSIADLVAEHGDESLAADDPPAPSTAAPASDGGVQSPTTSEGDVAEPGSAETVRQLAAELDRLRDRVVELESELTELRVRNRRLEQLHERDDAEETARSTTQ